MLRWTEGGEERTALWRSERGAPPPAKVRVVDDRITADAAYGLAAQGVGLLWRGDFQNARQLLVAMGKRAERGGPKPRTPGEAFNVERQARAQRARTLGMLLVPVEADYAIALRRAPDFREALVETWGPPTGAAAVSLRELQGIVGAHEWRRKGIAFPKLGFTIHPHYGVFSPVRSEYVDLVARAPLPAALKDASLAFDVGTGTGVLAIVLAKRGIDRVVATDQDPRALECARQNVDRAGLGPRVEVAEANLFPEGRAALVVCNPPWVPARPSSPLEHGIYDPDSRMLQGFIAGLPPHLAPGGEGWLLLSNLAEHLGLRAEGTVESLAEAAGLRVLDRLDARPRHPKAFDASDPLHRARQAEITSLWRLAAIERPGA